LNKKKKILSKKYSVDDKLSPRWKTQTMSRIKSKPVKYTCDNDCRMEGCPGHEMRVTRELTSDTVVVEVDGELREVLGESEFCAMVEAWKSL
jgi:coenzyme F420-reducing hydrogenase gamma subunit